MNPDESPGTPHSLRIDGLDCRLGDRQLFTDLKPAWR
jgi:hypothetical protein